MTLSELGTTFRAFWGQQRWNKSIQNHAVITGI